MFAIEYWYLYFIAFILIFVIPSRTGFHHIKMKKRKGVKRKMPIEMLKDFIGKDCAISLLNDFGGVQGKILAVEENWIKVEEKKKIRMINGDMIQDISTLK